MFKNLVLKFLLYFNQPEPEISELSISGTSWLYIVACLDNYNNKNIFKIGYSQNVEQHLCSQLARNCVIDTDRSFKILMGGISDTKEIKKIVKQACVGHNLKCKSVFQGKSDWYTYEVLDKAVSLLNSHVLQEIDWKQYKKNRENFTYDQN